MKLVYIYGPPAAGKLSVAKQLAKITEFRLFHNHLTADYVSSIFPSKDKKSNKIKWKIATEMLELAAKHKVGGVIFTKVYDNNDKNLIKELINILKRSDGKILFVKLYCDTKKLYERVTNKSRKAFDKIRSTKDLKNILEKEDKYGTLPFKKTLVINNTNLSPKKCAKKIKEYYSL
ncbi:MAG: AAA family ATPase [Nanoarchaeota archaeon]|nr:AAA family ATPase [Nanoarchaeota archaeon]